MKARINLKTGYGYVQLEPSDRIVWNRTTFDATCSPEFMAKVLAHMEQTRDTEFQDVAYGKVTLAIEGVNESVDLVAFIRPDGDSDTRLQLDCQVTEKVAALEQAVSDAAE